MNEGTLSDREIRSEVQNSYFMPWHFHSISLHIKQVYKHTFDFFSQDSSKVVQSLSKTKLRPSKNVNL